MEKPDPSGSDQIPARSAAGHAPRLMRTAASLMSTTTLTSALGIVFWAVAARSYSVREVGIDGALISALVTLSGVSQLNLTNTIVRFLPGVRRVGWRIVQAYTAAAVTGLAVGVLFVVIAPAVSTSYHFLRADTLLAATFVLSLGVWTTFCLQDSVLIALGRAPWLPIENGLYALSKIILLPIGLLAVGVSGHGVLLAWVLPLCAGVPIINLLIIKRVLPDVRRSRRPGASSGFGGTGGITRFVGLDLIGQVLAQLGTAAVPLIVVGTLGAVQNAYFFLPFTLVTTADLVFLGVATAVTAEGSRDERQTRELVRRALRYLAALQIPVVIVFVVGAPLILRPFGPAYVKHGVTLVRLLAAASGFRSILFVFCAMARLERKGRALLAIEAVPAILLVALLASLTKRTGVDGVAEIWLAVNVGAACSVLPSLVRAIRPRPIEGAGPAPPVTKLDPTP